MLLDVRAPVWVLWAAVSAFIPLNNAAVPVKQDEVLNTARTSGHGAQGPMIILPKSLVGILTGTVLTHCYRYNKTASSSHPGFIAIIG